MKRNTFQKKMDQIRMNASQPVKAAPMMRDFPATKVMPVKSRPSQDFPRQLQKIKSLPKKAPKMVPQKMKKTRKYFA